MTDKKKEKEKMKRFIAVILAVTLFGLAGCSGTGNSSPSASQPANTEAGEPMAGEEAEQIIGEYVQYLSAHDYDSFLSLFKEGNLNEQFVKSEYNTDVNLDGHDREVKVVASNGSQAYVYLMLYTVSEKSTENDFAGYSYMMARENGSWKIDSNPTQQEYQNLAEQATAAMFGGEAAASKASVKFNCPYADIGSYLPGLYGADAQVLYQTEEGRLAVRVYFWNGTEEEKSFTAFSEFQVVNTATGKVAADLSDEKLALSLQPKSGQFKTFELPEWAEIKETLTCEVQAEAE